MAGHSKWANIKHRKGKVDAARGKIFTRISKEIMTAVKQGGSDPKFNPRLRLVLEKAREANVPKDNIQRVINKAEDSSSADYQHVLYELYGHGKVGLLVLTSTDNKNRLASDMRIAVSKRGGTIAAMGAVSHYFDYVAWLHIDPCGRSEEEMMEMLLDLGAADMQCVEGLYEVTAAPEDLYRLREGVIEKGAIVKEAELIYIPQHTIECSEEDAASNLALIEWLESLDDVDEVFHNMA